MHAFILKHFAMFEALVASCPALPSSCFLPVCNPCLCFVTREGFCDAFLSWKVTPEDVGSSAGKLTGGLQLRQPFLQAKPYQVGQREVGTCICSLD